MKILYIPVTKKIKEKNFKNYLQKYKIKLNAYISKSEKINDLIFDQLL